MILCKETLCTGCGACAAVCPKNAIEMVADRHGFLHPSIDPERCVDCGRCKSVCPKESSEIVSVNIYNDFYAAWDVNLEDRRASTSGGVFALLAESILQDGGIVYGVALVESIKVQHIRVETLDDLGSLRGSKYVQSNMNDVYSRVRNDLKDGRVVLFSGTPCQVAAVKKYVGDLNKNLITVDIVCHGVASQMVFDDYISFIENKYGKKVINANFRYKKPSWQVFSMKLDFSDGTSYIKSKFEDPYLYLFTLHPDEVLLRESCHSCSFTSIDRVGDITLADFWQYESVEKKQRGSNNGVSLVKVNTEKGKEYITKIQDSLYLEKTTIAKAYKSNKSFSEPWAKGPAKVSFWDDYKKGGFERVVEAHVRYDKKAKRRTQLIAFIRGHKYLSIFKLLKLIRK